MALPRISTVAQPAARRVKKTPKAPKAPQHMLAPNPEPPPSVSVPGITKSWKQPQYFMEVDPLVFVDAPEASSSEDENEAVDEE